MESYWNKKTFCVITGASRGIGRCIAIEFSKKLGKDSVVLLLARSIPGLESTKEQILMNRENIKVYIASVDLCKPDANEYKSLLQSVLEESESQATDFDHAMLVQNAANLGIQSGLKIEDMDNLPQVQEYYAFNLTSFIILNSTFFKTFYESSKQLRSIIHITSSGAIEPFKTWGLYCAGKAARDMLLKSMALESGINALNWAPGCVNTDIYEEAVKYTGDSELATFFEQHRKAGKVLTCEQTVTKLMKVLAGQNYTMGEHVCYDDIPDE